MKWTVKRWSGPELGTIHATSSIVALVLARARWPMYPDLYVFNMEATPDTTSYRDWWAERGY